MNDQLFERDITKLCELLDDELATVSSYVDGINQSESSYVRLMLTDLAKSHAARVRLLRERLEALGHRYRPNGGASSRLEGHAHTKTGREDVLRDATALEGLLTLEDRLLEHYRAIRPRLSAETRRFLDEGVMTELRATHLAARQLAEQVFPQATAMPW